MSGVKRFDEAQVLDRVAEQFWRSGYDGTSIQDLEHASGLGRGSLYNAFGDKEAIFLAALARYGATHGSEPMAHLMRGDARAGIAAMLRALAFRMNDPDRPRGCLVTNSCAAGRTDGIDAAIARQRVQMEQAIELTLIRALRTGQLAAETDVRALARFFTAVAQSLAMMSKAGADAATLGDVVTVAMRAWPDASVNC